MSTETLLPRHHEEFRSREYWDTFFQQRTDAFEWYGEYEDLRKLVHRTLARNDRILVVGCGNSNFSAELYDDGFEEVENVDFSQPVVAEMCRAHSTVRPKMTWRVMDVTDMSGYEDELFDAVIDKGTLDALMAEDTAEVRATGEAMLREVKRVLKPCGRYMCVTLWQEFIGSVFLSSLGPQPHQPSANITSSTTSSTTTENSHTIHDSNNGSGRDTEDDWTLNLHSAAASSKPSPYLPVCVVATKASSPSSSPSPLPSSLLPSSTEVENISGTQVVGGGRSGGTRGKEVNALVGAWCDRAGRPLAPGGKPSVLKGEQEVLTHVQEAQQMHRRRFDLREIRPGRFEEESLWGEGEKQASPRFTLFIVDVSSNGQPGEAPCAVVLIPRGRDRDFTFSAREGLEQVARSANARRLIAVRLNRGHDFSGGVEGVKAEISPVVSEFAPESSSADTAGPGIPIMAVSDGLGVEGRVVAEGRLECSGNFVIEEEEEEDEDDESRPAGVYRRLIFLKNEGVVQTEVRMLGEDEDDKMMLQAAARKLSSSKGGKKSKGKGKGSKGKKSSLSTSTAIAAGVGEAFSSEGGDGGGTRVDFSHLCFEYHRCMVAGAALTDFRTAPSRSTSSGQNGAKPIRAPTALVIGLGGGALPMALQRMYPGLKVLAVELDPEIAAVAKDHFGLKESNSLKVVVQDGLVFVNSAAATAAETPPPTPSGNDSASPETKPSAPSTEPAPLTNANETGAAVPPSPPNRSSSGIASAAEIGWGGAFGPPYSAIFLDADSKDTSVGMSCPPCAFLERAFLLNMKTLLNGGLESGTGGAGGGPAGVLAINVAARSKELFRGSVNAVCDAFDGGEVHKLRAGDDNVNSVVLALPRPRGRARSGPLFTLAEEALALAAVPRKAVSRILEVCERVEAVNIESMQPTKGSGGGSGNARQGSKSKNGKKRGGR